MRGRYICLLTHTTRAGERHPSEVVVGDDVCVRALGEPGGVRRSGQHVLHLQPEGQRRERQGHEGAGGAHRWGEKT